jgi:multicomponent Na+:H+ antiporter subunit D
MAVVLMVSSLLSIGYLMPIVVRAFFRPLPEGAETGMAEAPWLMLVPICLTAALCVAIFFWADGVYRLLAPVVGLGGA